MRPSFSYKGELVACEVWAELDEEFVPLNRTFRARFKLPYADALGWTFVGGEFFELCIASQVIGRGTVFRV